MEMLFQSSGFKYSNKYFPPFFIVRGDIVVLQLDEPFSKSVYLSVSNIFCTHLNNLNYKLLAPFMIVEENFDESIFLFFRRRKSVFSMIRKQTNMTDIQIYDFLKKNNISPNQYVDNMSLTSKKILFLKIASTKNSLVIYESTGLDWTGKEKLDITVQDIATIGAAIELRFDTINDVEIVKNRKVIQLKTI